MACGQQLRLLRLLQHNSTTAKSYHSRHRTHPRRSDLIDGGTPGDDVISELSSCLGGQANTMHCPMRSMLDIRSLRATKAPSQWLWSSEPGPRTIWGIRARSFCMLSCMSTPPPTHLPTHRPPSACWAFGRLALDGDSDLRVCSARQRTNAGAACLPGSPRLTRPVCSLQRISVCSAGVSGIVWHLDCAGSWPVNEANKVQYQQSLQSNDPRSRCWAYVIVMIFSPPELLSLRHICPARTARLPHSGRELQTALLVDDDLQLSTVSNEYGPSTSEPNARTLITFESKVKREVKPFQKQLFSFQIGICQHGA